MRDPRRGPAQVDKNFGELEAEMINSGKHGRKLT
jgi:hypothetical protein